jgi:hypothetical protein
MDHDFVETITGLGFAHRATGFHLNVGEVELRTARDGPQSANVAANVPSSVDRREKASSLDLVNEQAKHLQAARY